MYLCNAFSLNMLNDLLDRSDGDADVVLEVDSVTPARARELLAAQGFVSYVGHEDTARIFSSQLGLDVPCQRGTLALGAGDELVVGQYTGPRLPEGTRTLPEGARIAWIHIRVRETATRDRSP